jgi:hypothetical protein
MSVGWVKSLQLKNTLMEPVSPLLLLGLVLRLKTLKTLS